MAPQSESEHDLELDPEGELDLAALNKHERGEPLTSEEARRVRAFEERWSVWLKARFEAFEWYASQGIVERTKGGGYRIHGDVVRAEIRLNERRRHRPSRIPFRVALVRLVRAERRRTAATPSGRNATTARIGPRPRGAGRPAGRRSPPRRSEADSGDGEPAPPLSRRLTRAKRQFLKQQLDLAARARIEREKKLRLPDDIDRRLYCASGHLRATHERTVVDRSRRSGVKTECGACKGDRDAARSARPSWWLPRLAARHARDAGVLLGDLARRDLDEEPRYRGRSA
jgi:hypothetical protein